VLGDDRESYMGHILIMKQIINSYKIVIYVSGQDLQKGVPKMMTLWVIISCRAGIEPGDLRAAYGLF
jgi:hypothetical protein